VCLCFTNFRFSIHSFTIHHSDLYKLVFHHTLTADCTKNVFYEHRGKISRVGESCGILHRRCISFLTSRHRVMSMHCTNILNQIRCFTSVTLSFSLFPSLSRSCLSSMRYVFLLICRLILSTSLLLLCFHGFCLKN
jgi:hypothetical protein